MGEAHIGSGEGRIEISRLLEESLGLVLSFFHKPESAALEEEIVGSEILRWSAAGGCRSILDDTPSYSGDYPACNFVLDGEYILQRAVVAFRP